MAPLLEVRNLQVEVGGTQILNGLDLAVNKGEVHAIMGPNGGGKSTLSYVLAGKPGYEVTAGDVLLDGQSILEMPADERAAKGVFLAFQYPVEIPGVATMTFLRAAPSARRAVSRSCPRPTCSGGCVTSRPSSASITRCCAARSMSGSPAARRSATRRYR
jgi:FeS assembly ATPase SufC